MKKVEMLFYPTLPSEENSGLKFVLWQVTDTAGVINHDWGFAEWDGLAWQPIEVPEGYEAKVVWWSNPVDPEVLLKQPSKIIRI